MSSQEGLETRDEMVVSGLRKGTKPVASGHVWAQQPEDTEHSVTQAEGQGSQQGQCGTSELS